MEDSIDEMHKKIKFISIWRFSVSLNVVYAERGGHRKQKPSGLLSDIRFQTLQALCFQWCVCMYTQAHTASLNNNPPAHVQTWRV